MNKNFNNNRKKPLTSTSRTLLRDSYGYRERGLTDKEFETLAVDYIDWARFDENALNRSRFYRERSIPKQTFHDWCTKIPMMIEADAIVRDIIAERMIEGAAGCHRRVLRECALRHLWCYSDEEKALRANELEEKKVLQELRNKQEGGKIIVELDDLLKKRLESKYESGNEDKA